MFFSLYERRQSLLHRAPPVAKVASFALLLLCCNAQSWCMHASLTLVLLALTLIVTRSLKCVAAHIRVVSIYLAFFFSLKILHTFFSTGVVSATQINQHIHAGYHIGIRLFLLLCASSLFYACTSRLELFSLCLRMGKVLHVRSTAYTTPCAVYVMMLVLYFGHDIFREWTELRLVWRARTRANTSFYNWVDATLHFSKTLLTRLLERAQHPSLRRADFKV